MRLNKGKYKTRIIEGTLPEKRIPFTTIPALELGVPTSIRKALRKILEASNPTIWIPFKQTLETSKESYRIWDFDTLRSLVTLEVTPFKELNYTVVRGILNNRIVYSLKTKYDEAGIIKKDILVEMGESKEQGFETHILYNINIAGMGCSHKNPDRLH